MANTNCGVTIPTISSAFISKEGNEILSAMRAPRYVDYVNTLFGEVYAKEYIDNNSYITLSDFSDAGGDKLSLNHNLIKLYNKVKEELNSAITSEFSDTLPNETIEDLKKVYENWDLFVDYHSKYNEFISIKGMEEETDKSQFDKRGNEYSEFDLVSNDVRTLFKFLPKAEFVTDINGNLKIEKSIDPVDGLPVASDYDNIIKLTLDALKGVKDDKFIETLTSPDLLKKIPELEFLFRILPLRENGVYELQDKQRYLLHSMYTSFSRDYIPVHASTTYAPEVAGAMWDHRRYKSAKGNTDKIYRQLISNFASDQSQTEYSRTDNSEDLTNPEKGGYGRKRLYSLPKKLSRIELTDEQLSKITIEQIQTKYKPYFDFYKVIGIEFSDLSLLTSTADKEALIDILNSTLSLHDNISNRLEKGDKIYNPIVDTNTQVDYFPKDGGKMIKIFPTRDIFKKIVKFEAQFSKISPTVMSRGASGEKQSDISLPNALSIAAGQISSSNSLEELYTKSYFTKLRYNPLGKYSYVTNNIIGTQNKYTIENYSGNTIKSGEDEINSDTKSLSDSDKFKSDFSNLLGWGRINTPQLESKSSYFSLNFIDADDRGIVPFGKENFENGFTSNNSSFFNQILGYLRGELERVKQYPELKKSGYNVPEAYGKLHIFANMVDDKQLEKLLNSEWDAGSSIVQEIKSNIEKYFQDEFNRAINFIALNKIDNLVTSSVLRNNKIEPELYKDNPQYYQELLLRTFLANDFIHNVEFGIFMSGDPLFFKDWHKRLGGLASTGVQSSNTLNLKLLFAGDREKVYWDNYSLRGILNQYADKAVDRRDNFDTFQSAVLEENNVKTGTAYQSKQMVKDFIDSYFLQTGKTISIKEAEDALKVDKINKDGIDVGDGQGYLNMDAHRELSIKQNTYRPQHDVSYKYEALIFKKDVLGKKLSDDEQAVFDKVESQIMRDPHRYALPILKQTYYGTLANENVHIDAKVFDKFSLAPLLPSIAKNNPKLKKLLLAMAERQIHYVKYKSGTKGYVKNTVKNLDDLFNPKFELDLLKSELLKLQILPSKVEKTETGLATQMTKLLYTNLFDKGVAVSEGVAKQRDKFISDLNNIQSSNKRYVLNKLGFKTDKEGNIISWDKEKIIESLIKQVNIQKLPSSLLEALKLNSEGQFINTVESSGIYQQLMNYVVGKLDSGLRQFKLNAADFVLISESMFEEPLRYFRLSKDRSRTEPLECRITLTKEFIKLLELPDPKIADKKIGTIDRLNQLLKDKAFVKDNEKALTITFSRPPVQGPNSMGVAIVKEFFSPTAGNILQLPKEFMHQAGIDFDYDKEKVYLPSLSNDGLYLSDQNIQKRLEQIENEYQEFRELFNQIDDILDESEEYEDYESLKSHLLGQDNFNKLFTNIFGDRSNEFTAKELLSNLESTFDKGMEYLDLKFAVRALNNNSLLQSMIDSVMLPELFSELTLPNTDTTVKPLARQNGEDINNLNSLPIGNSVYTYMENLKVFKMFNDAKALLGPFALNNVFSQLIAPLNIQMMLDYDWSQDETPQRRVNLLLLPDSPSRLRYGSTRVNLSTKEDADGQNKQHLNSEFINATVDSNKDPYFANFMLSFDNINTFLFLFNIGYPVQTIVNFTSSAIVRKYLELKKRNPDAKPEELAPAALNQAGWEFKGKFALSQIMKEDANNIKNDNSEIISKLKDLKSDDSLTEENRELNRALLLNFIAMEVHSKAFSSFKNLFKNDTNKTSSLFEIYSKEQLRDSVIKTGMFSREDIQRVENQSTMTAFRNDDVIGSVLKQVFPIVSEGDVVKSLGILFSTRKPSLNPNEERILSQVITNDYIGSILFTYGYYKEQNLFEYARNLVRKVKQGDDTYNTTLLERLYNLRQNSNYEKLSAMFPVLSKITGDIPQRPIAHNAVYDGSYAFNLLLDVDPNMPLIQKEGYMNQFKQMLSGDFELKDTKAKENLVNFIKDFFIAGLVQSGFNKTGTSYFEYLPINFAQELLNPALNFYNFEIENSDHNHKLFLNAFQKQFRKNNPNYFYLTGEEREDVNKNSYIGKDLRVVKYPHEQFTTYQERAIIKAPEGANDLENPPTVNTSTIEPKVNNTFEYKGKSIETEFPLGDEQRQALEKLIDFVSSDDDLITLQGAAGTGKTSIIGYLQKYLGKGHYFAYMAPTHAATAELAFSTAKTGNQSLPSTLQSSITISHITKKPVFTQKVAKKIPYNGVVILDEASMIDGTDLNNLRQAAQDVGAKVIFLGDEKQISKVVTGNVQEKTVSPAFTDIDQVNLTKIFRQSNNSLLALLSMMRQQTDFKLFKVPNSDSVKFVDRRQYNKELIADLKANPENTVVVSYTNNSVKGVNASARKVLGREGYTQVGDIAIGYLGYASKQIEKGDVANSISYTITEINEDGPVRIIYAKSAKLAKLLDLGIVGISSFANTKYYQLDSEDSFQFDLTQADFEANNRTVSDIFKGIHDANEQYKNKEINYATYLGALAGYTDVLRKVSVGGDYVYNPKTDRMEKFDSIKHKDIKTNGQGSLLMNKDIDYGHGITIHKSQGSTIDNVYFDSASLKSASNTPIVDNNGNKITTEKQSLAYVAMSRSKNKLVVYEGDNEFEDLGGQEESTSQEKSSELFDPKLPKINIYAETGENSDLSNMALRPFTYNFGSSTTEFNSVEQAYQMEKLSYTKEAAANYDLEEKMFEADPWEVKKLSYKIKGLDRELWDANSSRVMKNFLLVSFKQNPQALQKLLDTGNAELTHTQDEGKWATEFPKLLMEVRKELRGTLIEPQVIKTSVRIVKNPWEAQARGEGISVIRGIKGSTKHYGNPFSHLESDKSKHDIITMGSIVEAVQAYKDWLAGVNYQEVEPERRAWINQQINSGNLDGKILLYYKQLDEPSHADALAEIINSRKQRDNFDNKIEKADSNEITAKDFINNSGGAFGSDKDWDDAGRERGFIKHNHYYIGEKDRKNAPYGNVEITEDSIDYQEGRLEAAKAAAVTYGYQYSVMKDVRLIRNWAQVKHSDAVFAIGHLVNEGARLFPDIPNDTRLAKVVAVTGGTGYAVQMAINSGKPVYVFDQVRKEWYKNINGEWSRSIIPVLTQRFAGIGTRNINEAGRQAIRDVYDKTLLNLNTNKLSKEEQKNLDDAGLTPGDCK